MQRIANAAYLEGFPFPALLRVAPYCVRGGIRVVSKEAHRFFTMVLARSTHAKYVQHLLGHASIRLTLDRYSHWIPSMGRATADGMDEALG
jgi:integrase